MGKPDPELRRAVAKALKALEPGGGIAFAWNGRDLEMGMRPAGIGPEAVEFAYLLLAARQVIDNVLRQMPQIEAADPMVRTHHIDIEND